MKPIKLIPSEREGNCIAIYDVQKQNINAQTGAKINVLINLKEKTIQIDATNFKGVRFQNKFVVGSSAEYDLWNLIYTGEITNITEHFVFFGFEKRRLSMADFIEKNWDFDWVRISKHNADEMQYI